jgi:hypothetical protein
MIEMPLRDLIPDKKGLRAFAPPQASQSGID